MENLMKIRDVSLTYGVSVRTLRYYEDMGLLQSTRESETTYRTYQSSQIHKLEQILMLRKLHVSIKDIKVIFETNQADVLLNILNHKVTDIDSEIADLYLLKELVQDFIQQLKVITFSDKTDIRLLMEKISTFERQIAEDDNICKHETSDTKIKEIKVMSGIPDVRIVSLPACKMVSSGLGNFDQENFDRFDQWFSKITIDPYEMPKDFLWYDPDRNDSVWWYIYSEGMDTLDFPIEEFDGGLFASAVCKDGDDVDGNRVYNGIKRWVAESGTFELDERPNHYTMSHIITLPETKKVLGYWQLEILVPIKTLASQSN